MSKYIKPLSVVLSTIKKDENYIKHLKKMFSHPKTEILCYENNNEKSLSEIYNIGLNDSSNDIVVFLHDDLIIMTPNLTPKINKLFDNNPNHGIIGLAGTNNLLNGVWWSEKESMFGIVGHEHENKKHINYYSSSLGEDLKNVVVVDGLFMCIHKNRIKHKFNEEFKDFHFYDLPICVDNFLDNVKIGVTTKIFVYHKSIGMVNKKWEKNKLLFEALYQKHLPLTI